MKTKEAEVVQMKLVTGDEVSCIFSNENESDENSFMVHSILQMIPLSDTDLLTETETESYILRPYITYTDNLQRVSSINPVTVVTISVPSVAIEAQYFASLAEIEKQLGYRIDKAEEDDDYIPSPSRDSGVSNVLSFPPRKQLLTEE
jgi:hypothetical protein